jgi:hypothetical protein
VGRPQIEKVKYSHDAMIDALIANPRLSQNAIAQYFGYTVPWVSTIMASDAFQARLGQRRHELLDPAIAASIEERFKALATRSLEILQEKLAAPANQVSDQLALRAAELGAKALGIGGNAPPRTIVIDSGERLAGLAHRLTNLMSATKRELNYVESTEVREIFPDEQGHPEQTLCGSESDEGQPIEGTVRTNGRTASEAAGQDGRTSGDVTCP